MRAMETLNLNANAAGPSAGLAVPLTEVDRKRPWLAWLLSFFCPGAGQLYCGFGGRGITTLVIFWAAALVTVLSHAPALQWGIALRYALALWCFATLDAFFSAREMNSGIAPLMEGANPRVAAILNLTTKGWGYFYLGKKGPGIAVFLLLITLDGTLRTLKGPPRLWLSAIAEVVMIGLCVHAYLLGRNQLAPSLPPETIASTEDGLSVGVPVACAAFVAANYLLLVLLGLMLPNYKPVDQSKAVIEERAAAIIYRNAKYGVSIEFPSGWSLSRPENQFVMGSRPGGGCVVQLMAAAELPFVTRKNNTNEIIRLLTAKGYVYEQQRNSHLGNLAASEVTFRHHQGDDGEIDQSYLFTKKGLSSYVLITSMSDEVRSKCEALSEQIRSSVRVR